MLRFSLIVVLICLLSFSTNAEFPDDPKPCKYGDSECIIKLINYYMNEMSQGDSSINLGNIDPLLVEKMSIKQGANSPVSIDLTFTNSKIIGLKDSNTYKVKGFGKDIAQKHEIRMLLRKCSIVGDYKISGKVLILPISGSGKSNMTMVNADMVMRFTGTPVEKADGTYMQINDLKMSVRPERIYYLFENLFNDKALSDGMNLFLNENWRDISTELHDSITFSFSPVYQKVIDDVFAKYPYEKYFTE